MGLCIFGIFPIVNCDVLYFYNDIRAIHGLSVNRKVHPFDKLSIEIFRIAWKLFREVSTELVNFSW